MTFTLERRGRQSTYAFKDDGKVTITWPSRREGGEPRVRQAEYIQDGTDITITMGDFEMQAAYDGEGFARAPRAPRHEGFYKEEIKRISMLGDGNSLEWHRKEQGLVIKTPAGKPCDYAYVFKFERHHHPKIK